MDFNKLGEQALASQQFKDAASWFEKQLGQNPSDDKTRIKYAYALQRQGLLSEAIELYKTCLSRKPNSVQLYRRIGRAYYEQHAIHDAILAHEQGLRIAPNDFSLYRSLAKLYGNTGMVSQASKTYDDMLKAWPNKPELLFDLAVFTIRRDDARLAITYYEKLSRVSQGSFKHLCLTADFESRFLEDFHSALQNYTAAIAINSECLEAHSGVLNVHLAVGSLSEAEQKSNYLINHFPFSPAGFFGLAKLHERKNTPQIALEYWIEAVSRFPINHVALKRTAQLQVQLGLLSDASNTYRALLQYFPYKSTGLVGLVDLAYIAQDYSSALEACDELIQKYPAYLQGYTKRAVALLHVSGMQDAVSFLRNSLTEDVDLSFALKTLYAEVGDSTNALVYSIKHYQSAPSVDSYGYLMRRALRVGDIEWVETLLDSISNDDLFYSRHRILSLLRCSTKLAMDGAIDCSWMLFQSILALYKHAKSSHWDMFAQDSTILGAVFLNLLRSSLRFGRTDISVSMLRLVESYHDIAAHPWFLSCGNFFQGMYYLGKSAMSRAVIYFQQSILLNPESDYCLPKIKKALRGDYQRLSNQLFAGPTTGAALMIISCRANQHKIDFVREHYYSSLQIPYCFVVGDPELNAEWEVSGDILRVRCPDSYESLTQKVLKAFSFFYLFTDFSGVLKLDDDCAVTRMQEFRTIFQQDFCNSANDYMGTIIRPPVGRAWHFGKCIDDTTSRRPYALPHQSEWCGGGEGYFLSRRSLECLFEYTTKYPDVTLGQLYEDVFVSWVLARYNISPVNYSLPATGLILVDAIPSAAKGAEQHTALHSRISSATTDLSSEESSLALDLFRGALEDQPSQSPEVYSQLANVLQSQGLLDDAVSALRVGISRFPENLELKNMLDHKI